MLERCVDTFGLPIGKVRELINQKSIVKHWQEQLFSIGDSLDFILFYDNMRNDISL